MNKGEKEQELTYEQQLVRQQHNSEMESLKAKTMVTQFDKDIRCTDKNLQPPDMTNTRLDDMMQILKRKISSNVTQQNFSFWRKEIERLVDLGYSCRNQEKEET